MEIFCIFDHQVPIVILQPVIMHLAMCTYFGHDHKRINIWVSESLHKRELCNNLPGTMPVKIARIICKLYIWYRITGILDFFPSSNIVDNRKHDISETGSVFILRWKLITIIGKHLSDLHSYLFTWDQANSARDNKKIYNINCDKAHTFMELG
jgi:hypothetical protein